MRLIAAILIVMTSLWRSGAADAAERFFRTSDGVRLHYTDTGPVSVGWGPALVFVPGWTMPGWIFSQQVAAFAAKYRVVVLDPRGQGDSDVPPGGYNQDRRGQDIAELIHQLGPQPVVLVGWSLGVLDALAYVHNSGDAALAGMVLIDNSVGENPPPTPSRHPPRKGPPLSHERFMAGFVRSMFARPQPPAYLAKLTEAALRTPPYAASELLSYPVPRTYWREAIYATTKPVLYIVRPGLAGQAANLEAHHPDTEAIVNRSLGHAMFVDDPVWFDSVLQSFLSRRVEQR